MARNILLFFVTLSALCSFSVCVQADGDYNPLVITSPKQDESLYGCPAVHISWATDMGEGFTYSISFSTDGKVFSIPIATSLKNTKFDWKSNVLLGSVGWIKVKMMDYNGMVLAESIVGVNWIPKNAIVVSKANQRVYRFVDGKLKYSFICSTALPQFDGTEGEYRVYSRQLKHWSKKYELWMPYTIFFFEGYALHATTEVRRLGSPASHGCVRLHPRDARILYNNVRVGDKVIVLPVKVDVGYLDNRQLPIPTQQTVQSAKRSAPF